VGQSKQPATGGVCSGWAANLSRSCSKRAIRRHQQPRSRETPATDKLCLTAAGEPLLSSAHLHNDVPTVGSPRVYAAELTASLRAMVHD
jgi:hypothetical protein